MTSPFIGKRAPVKPGVVLRGALRERNVTQTAFARASGCEPKWVANFIAGQTRINAFDAIRIGQCLGTSPQFWMDMQRDANLYSAYRRMNGRNGKSPK